MNKREMKREMKRLDMLVRRHPGRPVVDKKFRIQKEVLGQIMAEICPSLSEDELMKDVDRFLKLNEWAHDIAVGRLTLVEQRAFRRNVRECRPIMKRWLELEKAK